MPRYEICNSILIIIVIGLFVYINFRYRSLIEKTEISLILRGFIEGVFFWTCIVVLAWLIYPIGSEGWEAAGFLLMMVGFPATYLSEVLAPNSSVLWQVIWFSILGYLQWPILGLIWGVYKKK